MDTVKFHWLKALLCVAALALAGANAMADDNPRESDNLNGPAFKSLDTNHDGYIDQNEAAADPKVLAAFDKADRDKDGKLSVKEFYHFVPDEAGK